MPLRALFRVIAAVACVLLAIACGSDDGASVDSTNEDGGDASPAMDSGGVDAATDTAQVPTISIVPTPADVAVPRAGSATVALALGRTGGGAAGAVDITVTGLPAGVTARPLTIGAKANTGTLTLDGAANAVPTVAASNAVITAHEADNAIATATLAVSIRLHAGEVDTTFGTAGWSVAGIGTADDEAMSIALQSDGKIVAGGASSTRGGSLVRYNANGAIDMTFGTAGRVFPANLGPVIHVEVQADGKILALSDTKVVRLTAAGVIDATFATAGTLTVANASLASLAIQPDTKIVVAGTSADKFFAARYAANGTPDATFGGTGSVTTAVETTATGADVALQTNGAIVVAGTSVNGVTPSFAVVRYTPSGTLDPTFDADGIVTTHIASFDQANAVVVQSDGKIVAGGRTKNSNGNASPAATVFALVRYTTAGALDATFDTDGIIRPSPSSNDEAAIKDLAIRGNRIVAVGKSTAGAGPSLFVVDAYSVTDGSVDATFVLSFGAISVRGGLNAVLIQPDDKVVMAGSVYADTNARNQDFALLRATSTGAADATFDADGIVTTNVADADDTFEAIALQADGKIVAVGTTDSGPRKEFFVARFLPTGALDTTFDTDGIVRTNLFNNTSMAHAVAIQPDGKIVVAGETAVGVSSANFAVARYDTNGSLDAMFAGGVAQRSDGRARGVVVQADGKIVASGSSGAGTNYLTARFNTDGTNDSGFTGGAVDVGSPGGGYALALLSGGKLLAAGSAGLKFGFVQWASVGGLDGSFDSDGRAIIDVGSGGPDVAYALAVQASGKIVAAGYVQGATTTDFVLARLTTSGALDATFGTAGKTITTFGSDAFVTGLRAMPDDKLVAAGVVGPSTSTSFVAARYGAAGALDPAFATAGIGTYAYPGGVTAKAQAVVRQPDGKLVIAGTVGKANEALQGGLLRIAGD